MAHPNTRIFNSREKDLNRRILVKRSILCKLGFHKKFFYKNVNNYIGLCLRKDCLELIPFKKGVCHRCGGDKTIFYPQAGKTFTCYLCQGSGAKVDKRKKSLFCSGILHLINKFLMI